MKVFLIIVLAAVGCSEFINHPQYCHTDADCLNGQYCPTLRAPQQSSDVCQGKAIISPIKLGD